MANRGPLPPDHSDTAGALRRVLAAQPDMLVRIITELHRPVVDDASLRYLLRRAIFLARECIDGAEWCSITTRLNRTTCAAAHTDRRAQLLDDGQRAQLLDDGQRAQLLDDGQRALKEGPSLQAMRTGQVVAVDKAELACSWPSLAHVAADAGIYSVLAAPLPRAASSCGSLTLYSSAAELVTVDSLDVITVLGQYLGRAIEQYATVHSAATQVAQLTQAIASRAPIEQAKGILMAVHQISAAEAFELLCQHSQNSNTKLRDLAAAFVAAQSGQAVRGGQD